jgi:Sec7-like guanine-nucleotide exchange factor
VETLQNMEKEYKNSNESPSTCEKYNYTATEFEGLVETQPPCVRHYNEFAETPSLQSCSMCKNDRFIIIRRNCERKNRLIKLIEVFNRDPGKGIDLLIENNFVKVYFM